MNVTREMDAVIAANRDSRGACRWTARAGLHTIDTIYCARLREASPAIQESVHRL